MQIEEGPIPSGRKQDNYSVIKFSNREREHLPRAREPRPYEIRSNGDERRDGRLLADTVIIIIIIIITIDSRK